MKLFTGISGGVKSVGWASGPCHSCGRRVRLELLCTYLTPRILHIPTVKLRKQYAAVCRRCGHVMALSEQAAARVESGLADLFRRKDLAAGKFDGRPGQSLLRLSIRRRRKKPLA